MTDKFMEIELFGGPLDGAMITHPPLDQERVNIGMFKRKCGYFWDKDKKDECRYFEPSESLLKPYATYALQNGRWEHVQTDSRDFK
jgi:hypothetical protein